MKGIIKWGLIALGCLILLVAGAVMLIPRFVDIKQYKPEIEQLVSEQAGRPFSIGDDMDLSVFPWVGVKLSDLKLGNPKGFSALDMVTIKTFEVRLKVMPLLSKQIEVKTFLIDSPQIYLEKDKNGKGNWENLGQTAQDQTRKQTPKTESTVKKEAEPTEKKQEQTESGSLPIEALTIRNFSIVNGLVHYVDPAGGVDKKLTDFRVVIENISLDKPIPVELSVKLDGKPLSLSGEAGPVGKEPGKGDIPLNITLKALDLLVCKLKGAITDPAGNPGADLSVEVDSFSPRNLMAGLGMSLPMETSDPKVLDSVSLKTKVKADAGQVAVSDGVLTLDDSTLKFSARVKEYAKPDIQFDLALDQIDLDRYLPQTDQDQETAGTETASATQKTTKTKTAQQKAASAKTAPVSAKEKEPAETGTDYTALRQMVVDGKLSAGKLKAANVIIQSLKAQVQGKDGVFKLAPVSLSLYQGSVAASSVLDIRKNTPKTQFELDAKNIQAAPLVQAAAAVDVIEGTLAADMKLAMTGETPDMIKKTVSGKGQLRFTDGAIVGVDLANMVRNAGAKVGLSETVEEKPRTDFSELSIPFSLGKGTATVTDASLVSPLLRVATNGKAQLIKETLDFKVDTKLVATLKGQGDTKDRSGLTVPVLITGTFAQPKIRVDLEELLKSQLPDADSLKSLIQGGSGSGTSSKSVKEQAKGVLNSLIPGLTN